MLKHTIKTNHMKLLQELKGIFITNFTTIIGSIILINTISNLKVIPHNLVKILLICLIVYCLTVSLTGLLEYTLKILAIHQDKEEDKVDLDVTIKFTWIDYLVMSIFVVVSLFLLYATIAIIMYVYKHINNL